MKNIGIIGLGLIGASLAKAFQKHGDFNVLGWDRDNTVNSKAVDKGTIHEVLSQRSLRECDFVMIALYPQDTIEYIKNNFDKFDKDAVIMDTCGVKKAVCDEIFPFAEDKGFTFIGTHPMAGIEYSGFDNSKDDLFDGASIILVPGDNSAFATKYVAEIFKSVGFGKVEITTPEEHDKKIAYTSQLAHVVSSAYVKNPLALCHSGFSAGSFHDMTRVAKLNETMWTELFLDNKDYLVQDIDRLIDDLTDYRDVIKQGDKEELLTMLKNGRQIRENLIQQKSGEPTGMSAIVITETKEGAH